MAIPGALLLAPSLMQSATGMYQAAKGGAMKPERPDYEIPQEVLDNLTDAEINALQGLPDATVQQFVENAQRASQTAMAQMSGRKAGTSAIGGLYQKELDAYKNLLSEDALARTKNQALLTGARKDVASEKARAFDLNKYQPYLADAQAKRDLTGAGLKNIFGGLQTGMKMKMQQDLLAGLQDTVDKAVPPPADSSMIDMSASGLFKPNEITNMYDAAGNLKTTMDTYDPSSIEEIDYSLNEDGEVSIDEYDEQINETDFDMPERISDGIDMSTSGLFNPEEMGGQIDYLNKDGEVSIDEYDEEINETDFDMQNLFGTTSADGVVAVRSILREFDAGNVDVQKAQRILNRIQRQYRLSAEAIGKILHNESQQIGYHN